MQTRLRRGFLASKEIQSNDDARLKTVGHRRLSRYVRHVALQRRQLSTRFQRQVTDYTTGARTSPRTRYELPGPATSRLRVRGSGDSDDPGPVRPVHPPRRRS